IRDSSVTGVQTCALPILQRLESLTERVLAATAKEEPCGAVRGEPENDGYPCVLSAGHVGLLHVDRDGDSFHGVGNAKGEPQAVRSEERRVGKGWKVGVGG